jgi:hypothetical protein
MTGGSRVGRRSVYTGDMDLDSDLIGETTIDPGAGASAAKFRRQRYIVVPRLIDASLAAFFWSYVHTKFASRLIAVGDRMAPITPGGYGDPTFDGLLEFLRPRIEEHLGLALHPTFSYFRFYGRRDKVRPHRDRPACEISVSLNVGQTPADPWRIHLSGPSGPAAALLGPGDALLYRGLEIAHWRDAYEGRELVQLTLHYVDRDGPHADQKFDRRPTLMRPPSTRRPFLASAD